jgi:PAS domain S-box-containing protein
MTWHFHTYAVAYIVNALFAALFCIFTWRRRSAPGVVAFALLMLAITDWAFLRALEAMVVEAWAKVLWAKLEYTGIASVGVLWLIFSARFSNQDKWLTKKTVGLLWVIPVFAVLMALSNDWHRLLWSSITPGLTVGSDFLIYHHGPWFWVVFSYTYLTLFAGSFLLVRAIVLFPRLYRHQIFPLFLGVIIPWVGNLIYVSGKSPVPGMDLTPFSFTVVGFVYYWSLFRSQLFEVVPIARELVIESINDGVIVLDTMNRIVDLNPAARRLLGGTNTPIGKNADEVLDWLPSSVTRPSYQSIKRVELTVKRETTQAFAFDISPLVNRYGRLCGHLVMMRDVTEQKRAQEKLSDSERRYREHVEEIGDIVYVLDKNRNIKYANNALGKYIGYPVDDRNQKNFKEIISPQLYDNLRVLFGGRKSGDGKRIFEIELAGGNNEERIFEVIEKTITDGDSIVEIHGIGRDITDRKRAEKEQKESEERYRELVENIDDIVYVTEGTGRIIYLNKAFEHLSGYTREEMLRKNYMEILTPESLGDVLKMFKKQKKGQNLGVFEMSFFDKDGTEKSIEVREKHIFEGDRVIEVHGLGRDITQKKKMALQLLQAEKLSAVGTMISGVAHELNNPLTSIIGNAQMLAKRDVPEDIKGKLEVIIKESIRSSKIVGGLLAFAREHKPERKMININDTLMESLKLREYDLKVSNISVQTLLSEDLPETSADAYQLHQVFINIINNARDALSGKDRAALAIRTYRKDDGILIEFDDNGPGISKELVKKIFDPFFTTKEAGKGTGLGLSMAYGIIKEHGGTISIESKPGKGAKFTVTLPIVEDREVIIEDLKAPMKVPHGVKTVLVVEDEASLRDLLAEALTEGGFFVEEASSGAHAMHLIGKRKFDAVISDIKMPGIGGKELYLYIQKHHPEMAEKVVFITGDVLSKDTLSFLQITNNRYIEKPFDVDALVALLNDVLSE